MRNTRVRGSSYVSPFIDSFTNSSAFLNHMSTIFGEPVIPVQYHTTAVQINYGEINPNKKVDEWHFDSVPYVAVIIISDMEGMIGGDLEILKEPMGAKNLRPYFGVFL